MGFTLTSNINIGNFTNVKVESVKINRSILSYVDTATITMPAAGRIKQPGAASNSIIQLATKFNVGDSVSICLGYNNTNKQEFGGFITRVNRSVPLVIECEGYSSLLKKISFSSNDASQNPIKLSDLFKLINSKLMTTKIKTNSQEDFDLGIVTFNNKKAGGPMSGTDVLDMLKTDYGLMAYFINFSTLYVGLDMLAKGNTVKYQMGWNAIRDANLKYHVADDTKITVKVTSQTVSGETSGAQAVNKKKAQSQKVTNTDKPANPKGTSTPDNSVTAMDGDADGFVTQITLKQNITDTDYLCRVAENELKKLKYNGFQGKLTAFLQPYCQPGDSAYITDPKYPEVLGTYVIDSIEVDYSEKGARRIIGIGEDVSDSSSTDSKSTTKTT